MEQGVLAFLLDTSLPGDKTTRPIEPSDLSGGGGGGGDASAANQVLIIEALEIINGNAPGNWGATTQVTNPANGDAAIAVSANITRNGLIIFNTSVIERVQLAFNITTNAQFTPEVVLHEILPKQTFVFSASEAALIREDIMFKGSSGGQVSINIREKVV